MCSSRAAEWLFGVLIVAWLSAPTAAEEPGVAPAPPEASADATDLDNLLKMAETDVSQLAQVKVGTATGAATLGTEVSTVARQQGTIGRTPAAVFVITNEMIRRSGAKTVPDALRMAPGVEVAQLDSNKWAIAIRGLNWRFSNELLVQIDGRSVYTPLFNCVFWDEQELLLEDVDRIEVIRGPGASLWGSNAVNGIINIITKKAQDTQGVYVESGVGTYQQGFAGFRYGAARGTDFHYRVHGKWFERETGYRSDGRASDDWRQAKIGFRSEWKASSDDTFTFQGDCYNGYDGDQGARPVYAPPFHEYTNTRTRIGGGNALVRWHRRLDEESDWNLQLYYDRTQRHWLDLDLAEDRNTFDLDFDYRFPLGKRHSFVTGFGYRDTHSDTLNQITSMFPLPGTMVTMGMIPAKRSDYRVSYFIQDRIALAEDRWYLTVGSKFEHSSWSNFEYQPTIRLLWAPDERRAAWGSVSRAVRTPSQAELNASGVILPWGVPPNPGMGVFPYVKGNPDMKSEELLAWELGYRSQVTERFSWDVSVFLYEYRNKSVTYYGGPWEPGPGGTALVPIMFANHGVGKVYGFELTKNYAVTERWKLMGCYSFLSLDFEPILGSTSPEELERQTPRNQYYLSSSWDLGARWELDMTARYVEGINTGTGDVPTYVVGDVRLAWRPSKHLEWSVVGRNLYGGSSHQEFLKDDFFNNFYTEVQQEVYTQIVWRR
ncbi:MAG: TonB-dependent receptor [Pirellulales bacterium]|nr:TonB-dependent receptor [Pirellulales bacterium]